MPLHYESGDLSLYVVPLKYRLKVSPRGELLVGNVEIDVTIEQQFIGAVIPIHASPTVGIPRASLVYEDLKQTFELEQVVVNTEYQLQELHFKVTEGQNLPDGQATLKIDFVSTIVVSEHPKDLNGVYRITMKDGSIGYATQFEPVGARTAFPCFDEPAARAEFEITVEAQKGRDVYSNTALAEKVELVQTTLHRFKPTPNMSTYLVGFVIGSFVSMSRILDVSNGKGETRSIKISVVGDHPSMFEDRSTKQDFLETLESACRAVEYFTATFKCFLPLEKLDLIEIPLSGLGMENFGMATFRTGYLINKPTVALRKRIYLLILHEISHMWFGNMVTVRWWSYLYLKEGFARLLEYTVASILYPEYSWWDHFLANHYGPSRNLDKNPERTHPVEMPIKKSCDAEHIFDFISYAKGASVLRMISHILGSARFEAALPDLINSNLYRSIETSDLLDAFNRASNVAQDELTPGTQYLIADANGEHVDLIDTMNSWVCYPGHPVVQFQVGEEQTQGHGNANAGIKIRFTQHLNCKPGDEEKFALRSPNVSYCQNAEGKACYPIPDLGIKLFFPDSTTSTIQHALYDTDKTFTIPTPQSADTRAVVLVNASHTGYFGVNYSIEQWHDILGILDRLSTTEVLGLVIEMGAADEGEDESKPLPNIRKQLFEHAKQMDNIDINAYLDRIGA